MQGRVPESTEALFSGGQPHRDRYRDSYLELFKDRASRGEISVPNPPSEDDWWALARHHGLITPLLDWTTRPYIAAFFALFEAHRHHNPGFTAGIEPKFFNLGEGHVAIWELHLDIWLLSQDEFRILDSNWLKRQSYRLRAQAGRLMRFEHEHFLDLGSWLKNRDQLGLLEVYLIPESSVPDALIDLRDMGISYFNLFPDLDGAATEANFNHRLDFLRWYPEQDE